MKVKAEITPILKVGAIGNPNIGDGRLVPYITVDCKNNKSLEKCIEIHGQMSRPGDVSCAWGWQRFNKSHAFLRLAFSRPMKCEAHLQLSVAEQGYVVDWILEVKGLYLQSSKYGNRASEGYGQPAVLVEVPRTATFPVWEKVYQRALGRKFKKMGVSKSDVARSIKDYKRLQREMWFRRPPIEQTGA